ncbi:hypothetical protein IQ06DRAFT_10353 [Phaeosphaeriaceae sp. SRC1lsM3a]|nr:hypothetical protein IQ06DRAFT_10353 [Stagonospora sp. SRC1lsM3a]
MKCEVVLFCVLDDGVWVWVATFLEIALLIYRLYGVDKIGYWFDQYFSNSTKMRDMAIRCRIDRVTGRNPKTRLRLEGLPLA